MPLNCPDCTVDSYIIIDVAFRTRGRVRAVQFSDEGGSSTLITEILGAHSKVIALSSKKYNVYMVEDSVPPQEFPPTQDFTPLPSTVEFSRIVANVIASLSASYFKQLERQKYSGCEAGTRETRT